MQRRISRDYFLEATGDCPVIPEILNEEGLTHLRKSDSQLVYILFGDICSIADIVERAKAMGKVVFVHVDLIEGLTSKAISVDFIKRYTKADGIISTKPVLIKRANELKLFSIQRFFMMDGLTYWNIERYVRQCSPDVVELMPAGLSKVIAYLAEQIHCPIVASGLTQDKNDIISALGAGADAVATSNKKLWNV